MQKPSKIIFLCSAFPALPLTGAGLREAGIIKILHELFPVEIISLAPPSEAAEKYLKTNFPMDLKLSFVQRERSSLLKKLFSVFRSYVVNGYSLRVEKKIKESYAPGAVLWASRLALAKYIPAAKRMGYKTILDEHNVESAYFFESIFTSKKWLQLPWAWQLKKWESRFCLSADKVIVTSERDQFVLKNIANDLHAFVLPNCVAEEHFRKNKLSEESSILFVGSLDYQPNIDGIYWFAHKVWPVLRERGVRFVVAGARPGEPLKNFLREQGIQLEANVADLDPLYETSQICVVPLLAGGGTRLKVLEALARGMPVVSTTKGAEGLKLQNEKDLLLADSPENFSSSILRLLEEKELRNQLASYGQKTIFAHYTWAAQKEIIADICQ